MPDPLRCQELYPWAAEGQYNPHRRSIFCALPLSFPNITMDPTRQFTDRLGVTVDSKSSYFLVAVLLVAGTYALAVPIISFIRVLLSLFILPGKSVSCTCDPLKARILISSAFFVRPPWLMGSHNWCQRWHRKGIRSFARCKRLQSRPRFAHTI